MTTVQFEYKNRLVTIETRRTQEGYAWSWKLDRGPEHLMRTGIPGFENESAAANAALLHAHRVIDHLERLKAAAGEAWTMDRAELSPRT